MVRFSVIIYMAPSPLSYFPIIIPFGFEGCGFGGARYLRGFCGGLGKRPLRLLKATKAASEVGGALLESLNCRGDKRVVSTRVTSSVRIERLQKGLGTHSVLAVLFCTWCEQGRKTRVTGGRSTCVQDEDVSGCQRCRAESGDKLVSPT